MAGKRDRADGPYVRASAGTAKVERVRKRDGREVPFELHKIQAALQGAMHACGDRDDSFASEVAQVVEMTLAKRSPSGGGIGGAVVPGIEDVQDLVERALMELGKPKVAKAFILYRERRREMRDAVQVHNRPGSATEGGPRSGPRVREAEGVSHWSSGRIVAALMDEAELPRQTADEVAAAVEARVLTTAPRHVTTGLVRELVASELFERGLTGALQRQSRIGVARRDVQRALEGRPLQPWRGLEPAPSRRGQRGARSLSRPPLDVTSALGGELLRRYAVSEILPEGVAELHLCGDLFVEGLERANVPLSLAVEAELLFAGRTPEKRAAAVLDGAAELSGEASRHLVLEEPDALLLELLEGSGDALTAWLHALGAVARARRVRIGLRLADDAPAELLNALVSAIADAPERSGGLELFLGSSSFERMLAFDPELDVDVEKLFTVDRLAIAFGSSDERFAAPGAWRRSGERGAIVCGGAVALHLPRLARRAGVMNEELVQSGLAELVQAALETARALLAFQREAAQMSSLGLHVRRSFAIVPVGLREALSLAGDGQIDPDQGARWLGLVAEAAGRFALEGADTVAPCSFFGEEAAQRFAWLDARDPELERLHQPSLFDETADLEPRPFRTGLSISPLEGIPSGAVEAQLWRALSSGVWRGGFAAATTQTGRSTSIGEDHPNLSAWRTFHSARQAESDEPVHELFPHSPKRPVPLRPLP